MRVAVALLAAIAFSTTAQAADISIVSFAGPTPIISVSGVIEPNDDLKFEQFAQSLKVPAIVKLESVGGNMVAGIGIGRVIARLGYSTYVGNQKVCASACGLIWLAGSPRMAATMSRVGLHASFIQRENQSVETAAGNALVGAYLNSLGFGDRFVVYATSAPPAGMNWLNKAILDQFGLSVELKEDVATLVTSGVVPASQPVVTVAAASALRETKPLPRPQPPETKPLPKPPEAAKPVVTSSEPPFTLTPTSNPTPYQECRKSWSAQECVQDLPSVSTSEE